MNSQLTIDSKKRIVAILVVIVFAFVVILARVFWLQFIEGPVLQQRALAQWASDTAIAPQRGSITDRNGNVLAKTVNSDTVVLRPQEIDKAGNAELVADELTRILGVDREEVIGKARSDKSEIWLERQVTSEQKEEIQRLGMKGVAFVDDNRRTYVYGDFLTQTMGMTNIDGEGLSGIESIYDKYLTGEEGKINAETDNAGRPLPSSDEEVIPPVDGYDVVLTIDYAVQSFLEKSLEDAVVANKAKSASGIVMNPNTGEILAISTKPGYDLNNPPRDNVELMNQISRNRVITDAYELGSVMKPLTMSAVLEEDTYKAGKTFFCPGHKNVDGEIIHCHADEPHGTLTLQGAMQSSCNPAFMEMGLDLGKEKYYEYLDKFGYQNKTGINFPGETEPLILHQKYINNKDLARISFGQAVAVTPLQLVTATSAMVNGGSLLKPYLVKEVVSQQGEVVEKGETTVVGNPISKNTSTEMQKMFRAVVGEGSGNKADIPGYRVGGKTGTAQKYDANGKIDEGKYITSFIGIAPCDDPEIVCFVMIDEPQVGALLYGSVIAAPVVKVVMENSLKYMNVPAQLSEKEKGLKMLKVPNVIGLSAEEAKSKLQAAGFTGQLIGESGKIERQFPVADTSIYQNSTVNIYPANNNGGEGTGRE